MATKTARLAGLTGMHTAGIYSDMTVDGPEIGTLVVVFDRAKNLPNRKTMGKQDPYCAARLGKEAKKTETDKRGGQTPKWDQEIRFTVHDSPDYHNLKVSVFNDDKKTELIGETWVSLEAVVVPGGGQNDLWHNLNCKGKYAGEIRIELTYYDTRPKTENPASDRRGETLPVDVQPGQTPSMTGPRESTSVKRRPLPAGPAISSPSSAIIPDHALPVPAPVSAPRSYHTPPRPLPQSAARSEDHTPSSQRRTYTNDYQPQPVQRQSSLPPEDASPYPLIPPSSRARPQYQPTQLPDPSRYGHGSPVDRRSPRPPVEDLNGYDGPRIRDQPDGYARELYAVRPIEPLPAQPNAGHRHRASVAIGSEYNNVVRAQYSVNNRPHSQSDLPHSHSAPVIASYQTLELARQERRDHNYTPPTQRAYHDSSANVGVHQTALSHYGAPCSHEAGYPAHVQTYDEPDSFDPSGHPSQHYGYHEHSHAPSAHAPAYMQPTVEDEDDVAPPPPPVHRSSAPAAVPQVSSRHMRHSSNMAPAPLSIATDRHRRSTHGSSPQPRHHQDEYSPSPLSNHQSYAHHGHAVSPSGGYMEPLRPTSSHSNMLESIEDNPHSLPLSLTPGYDATAVDLYHHSSRRNSRLSTGNVNLMSTSGPYQDALPPAYDTPPRAPPLSQQQHIPDYQTPPRPHLYDHHQSPSPHPYPSAEIAPMIKPRAISPDTRLSRVPDRATPVRKSVSPRPSSSADPTERRLSGAPFSPDSFDAYNPTLHTPHAASHSPAAATPSPDTHRPANTNTDANGTGQVVTFHGKLVDPSDHLPVEAWAPEPEPKGPKKDKPARERIGLTGAREPVPSGQRQRDRDAAIRNAVHAAAGVAANAGVPAVSPRLPGSAQEGAGRNRLQKRSPRQDSTGGMPLAERENVGGFGYGDVDGGMGYAGRGGPPPIPAKVPLDEGMMGGEMSALSRELSRIDISAPSAGARRGEGAMRRWR